MKTLYIERFFTPSAKLTQTVMQRVREHSLEDIQHSIESVEPRNPERSDDDELWNELLKASDQECSTPTETAADQRWLSEVLYGYLARLSDKKPLQNGESYFASEAIPEGMSNRVGLELNDRIDSQLLTELANEFQQWLAKCSGNKFVAGWGTISLDAASADKFILTKFSGSVEGDKLPLAEKAIPAGGRFSPAFDNQSNTD